MADLYQRIHLIELELFRGADSPDRRVELTQLRQVAREAEVEDSREEE